MFVPSDRITFTWNLLKDKTAWSLVLRYTSVNWTLIIQLEVCVLKRFCIHACPVYASPAGAAFSASESVPVFFPPGSPLSPASWTNVRKNFSNEILKTCSVFFSWNAKLLTLSVALELKAAWITLWSPGVPADLKCVTVTESTALDYKGLVDW